ncbi:MAG: DUF1289 domain-containing protein [Paracoccus denitrificans]|nr:MAG: DUF1289 domain-containing protein [Paracoccus denitrificans]PZO84471.1 MAG: DUF1289 domain-containing protein [Paracoccus denitrificans]
MSSKIPSPCIGVCKFKREGHCIGCSMTKDQKSLFKKIKKPKLQLAFIDMLIHQQSDMGKYTHWVRVYRRRCEKKGVEPPLRDDTAA